MQIFLMNSLMMRTRHLLHCKGVCALEALRFQSHTFVCRTLFQHRENLQCDNNDMESDSAQPSFCTVKLKIQQEDKHTSDWRRTLSVSFSLQQVLQLGTVFFLEIRSLSLSLSNIFDSFCVCRMWPMRDQKSKAFMPSCAGLLVSFGCQTHFTLTVMIIVITDLAYDSFYFCGYTNGCSQASAFGRQC